MPEGKYFPDLSKGRMAFIFKASQCNQWNF